MLLVAVWMVTSKSGKASASGASLGYYQIPATPEGLPFSVARTEAAEVEAHSGTAKSDWVEDVATVAAHDTQVGCPVAIDFDRAPVLFCENAVEAVQDASHSACLCYSIVQAH